MGNFLKIAGIVLGVFVFGLLFTLIPDYYATGVSLSQGMILKGDPFWAIGDETRFWVAIFGILPAIIMVILRIGKSDRMFYEEGSYRLGRIACLASIAVVNFVLNLGGPYNGPITHAFSFFFNIFAIIYFVYSVIIDGIFREKFSNEFFENSLLPIISGASFLILIGLSYLLAIKGIWLPQNINIPITIAGYVLPISAYCLVGLIIYELIDHLVSLPNNKLHSRPKSTPNYGTFEYCSASQMESYAKAACKKLNASFARINGKVIYLNGFVSDKDFWKAMLDVSGKLHSNVDGWWIRCQ